VAGKKEVSDEDPQQDRERRTVRPMMSTQIVAAQLACARISPVIVSDDFSAAVEQ